MNAVEIEQAVSELAAAEFDAQDFPFAFLETFGNKATTIKRLRSGSSNSSDLKNAENVMQAVLQRNNIQIATCASGCADATLKTLRDSASITKAKAKYILATDDDMLVAEELANSDGITSKYTDVTSHFGFFLPLAGASTVKQIKERG